MNKLKIFKSTKENNYLLSAQNIIFMPRKMVELSRGEVAKYSYYKKKLTFFEENQIAHNNMKNMTKYYDENVLRNNLANLRLLLIEVTDGCNLACKYCGYGELYSNYDERTNKKQSFENVKSLIDYLYVLWTSSYNISYNNTITIGFYGGEPLIAFSLIKQIITYIESLTANGFQFAYNMTTNGVLLNSYMDYLAEKKFRLLISLDGNKKNNSYRVTLKGKTTHEKVVSNILKLKNTYPEYFENYVNINSVLHKKNSIEEIYYYIKEKFNKVPSISELSSNGIAEDKKTDFFRIFKDMIYNSEHIEGCEDLKEDLLLANPKVNSFNYFIDTFTGNTYNSYLDLFIDEKQQQFIPTGTCHPFERKLFLTVNGKILPCERVGQAIPLAFIEHGEVVIDYHKVKMIYAEMYNEIIGQCENCILCKNCGLCIYFVKKKNNKRFCTRFISVGEASNYLSFYYSLAEEKPNLYSKLVNNLSIY